MRELGGAQKGRTFEELENVASCVCSVWERIMSHVGLVSHQGSHRISLMLDCEEAIATHKKYLHKVWKDVSLRWRFE